MQTQPFAKTTLGHNPFVLLFGCHIGLMKRIVGGLFGKSIGNMSSALKRPSSLYLKSRPKHDYGVSTGTSITIVHS